MTLHAESACLGPTATASVARLYTFDPKDESDADIPRKKFFLTGTPKPCLMR